MVSPFRRHQQHVRGLISGASVRNAAALTPPEPDAASAEGQEYALLRVLLHDNLRSLEQVQSIEARNPLKADYAKAFAPWIEGVLISGEAGKAAQDEILVTNMIWAVDYRDFAYALRLGAHAIAHHLILPERYKRSVACFLAEDIAELSLAQSDLVAHDHLLTLLTLVEGCDMPDAVGAKLHKALGRSWWRKADAFDPAAGSAPAGGKAAWLEQAHTHLQRAFALDKSVGVKSDLKSLEKQIRDLAAEAARQD